MKKLFNLLILIVLLLPLSARAALTDGLVGWWTLDGKNMINGVAQDVTGNGNKGTLVSIATSTFYQYGKIGQASNFDGTDDAIDVGGAASLNPNTVTLSAWIYPTSSVLGGILSNGSAFATNKGYAFYTYTDGKIYCDIGNTTTANRNNSVSYTLNKWNHVVCTYNTSTGGITVYNNGVGVTAAGTGGNITSSGFNTNIGRATGIAGTFFAGKIDDARIYNRQLSDKEVISLYNNSVNKYDLSITNISSGLLTYLTLDGKNMINGVAQDVTGNNNKGTLVNIATSTFYAPGKIGQAGNFDNSNDYVDLGSSVLLTAGSPFAISWWEKINSDDVQYPSRFNLDLSGSTNYFLVIRGGSNATTYGPLSWGRSPQSNLSIRSATAPTTAQSIGKWKHWVITGSDPNSTTPGDYQLYVDGVSQTVSQGPTFGTVATNRIGFDGTDGGSDANIDDLRVYNRILTAQEAKILYMNSTNDVDMTQRVIDSGLVGYWTMDGKDMINGVAKDLAGSNPGVLRNIATSTFFAPGQIGQSFNFDGVNDYVTTNYAGQLTNFTACSWFKVGSTFTQSNRILDKSYIGGFWMGEDATDSSIANSWGGGVEQSSSPYGYYVTLQNGKWHHLCMTRSGTTLTIIGDGGQVTNSGTVSATALDTTLFTIGAEANGATSFTGNIDEVRLYNRALSLKEIQKLYNNSVNKFKSL